MRAPKTVYWKLYYTTEKGLPGKMMKTTKPPEEQLIAEIYLPAIQDALEHIIGKVSEKEGDSPQKLTEREPKGRLVDAMGAVNVRGYLHAGGSSGRKEH